MIVWPGRFLLPKRKGALSGVTQLYEFMGRLDGAGFTSAQRSVVAGQYGNLYTVTVPANRPRYPNLRWVQNHAYQSEDPTITPAVWQMDRGATLTGPHWVDGKRCFLVDNFSNGNADEDFKYVATASEMPMISDADVALVHYAVRAKTAADAGEPVVPYFRSNLGPTADFNLTLSLHWQHIAIQYTPNTGTTVQVNTGIEGGGGGACAFYFTPFMLELFVGTAATMQPSQYQPHNQQGVWSIYEPEYVRRGNFAYPTRQNIPIGWVAPDGSMGNSVRPNFGVTQ